VPNIIKELLNARALAYWIMVDGGIDAFKATILNTDAFSLNDVNLLVEALNENFKLRTRLIKKTSWTLSYRNTNTTNTFISFYCRTLYAAKYGI